jgi:hypothetical protein
MAKTARAAHESETHPPLGGWRETASRLSLPILTTVVSAVLIANFVTSRQDAQHLQRQRDLQTKAAIADEMSDGAVRLIVAAEFRVRALVRRDKKRPSAESTARAVADFTAASTVIRAKLQAYYADETLAERWKRFTNAVGAYMDLGSIVGTARGAKDGPKLGIEIRRGLDGHDTDAAFAKPFPAGFRDGGSREAWIRRYDHIGNLLIARGADLTRAALE